MEHLIAFKPLNRLIVIVLLSFAAPPPSRADVFTFTTLDFPGALGINDRGQIVGSYYEITTGATIAFVYEGGVLKQLVGALEARDINNAGQIVGSLLPSPSASADPAFLYTDGMYSEISFPGAVFSTVYGLNDVGQVVGYAGFPCCDNNRVPTAFVYDHGTYKSIDVPGTQYGSVASGINNAGQIVGSYSYDATSSGFLRSAGVYTTIIYPDGRPTTLTGINDRGEVVGNVFNADQPHGFLYKAGTFVNVEVPGSIITYASGINNSGQIVGYFADQSFNFHAFIAQPAFVPEPGTFVLFGLGFTALGLYRLKRNPTPPSSNQQ